MKNSPLKLREVAHLCLKKKKTSHPGLLESFRPIIYPPFYNQFVAIVNQLRFSLEIKGIHFVADSKTCHMTNPVFNKY